jgi:hypothetical protein
MRQKNPKLCKNSNKNFNPKKEKTIYKQMGLKV